MHEVTWVFSNIYMDRGPGSSHEKSPPNSSRRKRDKASTESHASTRG